MLKPKRKYKRKIDEKEVVKAIKLAFPDTAFEGDIWLTRYQVAMSKAWTDKNGKSRQYPIGVPGMPDFIGILKERNCPECGTRTAFGTFLAIECKGTGSNLKGGKIEKHQISIVNRINDMDGIAIVYYPDPVDELINVRKQILKMIDTMCYCDDCRRKIKARNTNH